VLPAGHSYNMASLRPRWLSDIKASPFLVMMRAIMIIPT